MTDMKLTDMKLTYQVSRHEIDGNEIDGHENAGHEIDRHENDGHKIGGQDIPVYRLKMDYITMQCAIIFKTTAEYKSQQRGKLYRPPVIVE